LHPCRYRQQLEADRAELERIHAERLARLAAREDEVSEKLRRQQRDVEGIAYSQRQRILAEEDRLRNMKAEVSERWVWYSIEGGGSYPERHGANGIDALWQRNDDARG
jgi:hypothetical protein